MLEETIKINDVTYCFSYHFTQIKLYISKQIHTRVNRVIMIKYEKNLQIVSIVSIKISKYFNTAYDIGYR